MKLKREKRKRSFGILSCSLRDILGPCRHNLIREFSFELSGSSSSAASISTSAIDAGGNRGTVLTA